VESHLAHQGHGAHRGALDIGGRVDDDGGVWRGPRGVNSGVDDGVYEGRSAVRENLTVEFGIDVAV
jgi:hypothetical protein